MDVPSFNELFSRGQQEVLARQGLLSAASVQRPGSDANVMVAAAAAMGDQLAFVLTRMFNAVFFSTAQSTDLDRLALDRYGLVRKPASAALGSVQLSSPNPVPGAVAIPAGTIFSTTANQNFQSTQTVVWPVSTGTAPYTSPFIPIASTLAGANQQAAVGAITVFGGSTSALPASTTVSNPLATAGAADAETDSQFRARCIAFPQTLLQGTLNAIIQAGLAVPGVVTANAFEVLNFSGQQNAVVELVISDAFTDTLSELNVNPPAYMTQSQQLASQVNTQLLNARAGGVFVETFVAQVVLQPITIALSFAAGVDVDTAALNAQIAIVNQTNALVPGAQFVPVNAQNIALTVPGVVGATVISPAGPVVPTTLQVIRTSLGLVTAAASAGTIIGTTGNPASFSG